jgi:hypothetical protein
MIDHSPAQDPGDRSRLLWLGAGAALVFGLIAWATGTLSGGIIAWWFFMISAALVAFVLPMPLAFVSPLFMGLIGWLVDMLPTIILVGWSAVVLRWALVLWSERRLPRCGRWMWLLVGLALWTILGVVVVPTVDLRHFVLLVAIQLLISGVMLAVVDMLETLEDRVRVVSALTVFVVILSLGVFLEWVGLPVEEMQNGEVSTRVEEAYGLDAFTNSVGMTNYVRAKNAGAAELRRKVDRLIERTPGMPPASTYVPPLAAFDTSIVVRFEGSARAFEDGLRSLDIELLYDNIGLAPMTTVPRLRSFARNALTYAGLCVALFPLAFFLVWTGDSRRRLLGCAGVVSCLFGAGFSLARGAWIAVLLTILYLAIDGRLSWRRKGQMLGVFVAAAALVTAFYLVSYSVDPATGRAGARGSVGTRQTVYEETVGVLRGKHFLLGYGTTKARAEKGDEGGRYVPRAGTHSTYLNYLFRTGVVGGLGIMAVYAISWLHARAGVRVMEGREQLFRTLLTASIFGLAAHAAILSLYVEPAYTLTVSLLLALGVAGSTNLPISVLPWRRTRAKVDTPAGAGVS